MATTFAWKTLSMYQGSPVHSPWPDSSGSGIFPIARQGKLWRWGMSFFHVHSMFIQSQKYKLLTENCFFQTLPSLQADLGCTHGKLGGFAIYVREWKIYNEG